MKSKVGCYRLQDFIGRDGNPCPIDLDLIVREQFKPWWRNVARHLAVALRRTISVGGPLIWKKRLHVAEHAGSLRGPVAQREITSSKRLYQAQRRLSGNEVSRSATKQLFDWRPI
jgi:hypothetical protein